MSFNPGTALDRWGRDRLSGRLCARFGRGLFLPWWGRYAALVGLRVMIWVPAGVNFPLGCPEVSHLDPRSRQAGVILREGYFSAPWRGDLRELQIF